MGMNHLALAFLCFGSWDENVFQPPGINYSESAPKTEPKKSVSRRIERDLRKILPIGAIGGQRIGSVQECRSSSAGIHEKAPC